MDIRIKNVKPATPWNVTLTKLAHFEKVITKNESEALEARWLFGRELISRRIEHKGRKGIPKDLMVRMVEQCKLSVREVNYRMKFAEKYPTRNLFCNAIAEWPSWYQITSKALVEKSRASKKPLTRPSVLRKLAREVEQAYANHTTLSRDEVKTIEKLLVTLDALLKQLDRNDEVRAS